MPVSKPFFMNFTLTNGRTIAINMNAVETMQPSDINNEHTRFFMCGDVDESYYVVTESLKSIAQRGEWRG